MDAFISNQSVITQMIDNREKEKDKKGNIIKIQNPAWNDFKAGIGNVMPRIGDVDPVERIPQYDDYFNSNKTNVDFSEGFVDTILGYHDAEFAKREKETEQKDYYSLIGNNK